MTTRRYTNGAVAVYALGLLLIPAFIAWQGFCLELVWNWFAPAPLARLTFGAACGLDILLALVNGARAARAPGGEEGARENAGTAAGSIIGRQLLAPGFVLVVAWAVQLFVGEP